MRHLHNESHAFVGPRLGVAAPLEKKENNKYNKYNAMRCVAFLPCGCQFVLIVFIVFLL